MDDSIAKQKLTYRRPGQESLEMLNQLRVGYFEVVAQEVRVDLSQRQLTWFTHCTTNELNKTEKLFRDDRHKNVNKTATEESPSEKPCDADRLRRARNPTRAHKFQP